jgi:hypothetical protein
MDGEASISIQLTRPYFAQQSAKLIGFAESLGQYRNREYSATTKHPLEYLEYLPSDGAELLASL